MSRRYVTESDAPLKLGMTMGDRQTACGKRASMPCPAPMVILNDVADLFSAYIPLEREHLRTTCDC